jgi:hypothetical protein
MSELANVTRTHRGRDAVRSAVNTWLETFATFNVYTFRDGKVTSLELGLSPNYDKEKA